MGSTPTGKIMSSADGVCKYLDRDTNLCTIYEKRPLLCNVDAVYDKFYSKQMSKEIFYQLNQRICKLLQDADLLVGK